MTPTTNGQGHYITTAPTPVSPPIEAAHLSRTPKCQAVTTAGRCTRQAIAVFNVSGGLKATCASHIPALA